MFSVVVNTVLFFFFSQDNHQRSTVPGGLTKARAMTFVGTVRETDDGLQELPLVTNSFKGEAPRLMSFEHEPATKPWGAT